MTEQRNRGLLFALALLAWFLSFAILARYGTWSTFAVVGVVLTIVLLRVRAVPLALLRPSGANVSTGLLVGLVMVVGTHWVYGWLSALVPGVRVSMGQLLQLLNVAGFSASQRASLVVLIASCEEVLFRGSLPGDSKRAALTLRAPNGRELARVICLAAFYAGTTAPLGSALLASCAFLCGTLWGALRITTRSLVAPVLAHVVWDLGVLLVWPLLA